MVRPESTRRLGSFSQAGWSPHGLHVGRGARAGALDRRGPAATVKWTLRAPAAVHDPAWSTGDGFRGGVPRGRARCAWSWRQRRSGDDHPAAAPATPHAVTPAWRPAQRPRADLRDAPRARSRRSTSHTGRTALAARPRPASLRDAARACLVWPVGRLASSRSGQNSVTVLDRHGRVRLITPSPASPARSRCTRPGTGWPSCSPTASSRIRLDQSVSGCCSRGTVDGVAWSGTAAGCYVGWSGTDQWLILGPGRRVRGAPRSERRAGRRRRLSARGRLVLRALARGSSAAPASGSRPPAGTSAG